MSAPKCHWTQERNGERHWIPYCYGGTVGPEGCYCRDLEPTAAKQIEALTEEVSALREEIDALKEARRLQGRIIAALRRERRSLGLEEA